MASDEGLYVCTLDAAVQQKAAEELHEDPNERQSHLDTLRSWVKQQPHLTCRTDNIFLLQFLRVAKFSQLGARERLENYLSLRSSPDTAQWFLQTKTPPNNVLKLIDRGVMVFIKDRMPTGELLALSSAKNFDLTILSWDDFVMTTATLLDVILTTEETLQVHGMLFLCDNENFGLSHATSLTPSFVKNLAKIWMRGVPCRQKGSHYVNTPTFFNAVYELFKLFLPSKFIERLHFHKSSMPSLHEHVPKEILPEEYGGTAGLLSESIKYTKSLLEKHGDILERNLILSMDESKRPRDNDDDLEQASYRKLDVD